MKSLLAKIGLNNEQKELLTDLQQKKKELKKLQWKKKKDHVLLKMNGATLIEKNRLFLNYNCRQGPICRKITALKSKNKNAGIKEWRLKLI